MIFKNDKDLGVLREVFVPTEVALDGIEIPESVGIYKICELDKSIKVHFSNVCVMPQWSIKIFADKDNNDEYLSLDDNGRLFEGKKFYANLVYDEIEAEGTVIKKVTKSTLVNLFMYDDNNFKVINKKED